MTQGYNAASWLERHAAERPDIDALVMAKGKDWQRFTFGQLDARANQYARGFAGYGIQAQDRCLFLMRPDLEFYAAWFGLMKIGAVPVVLDPGMGPRKLLQCISRAGCKAVFGIPPVHVIRTFVPGPFSSASLFVTKGRKLFWGGKTLEELADPDASPFDGGRFDGDLEAAVPFTSGSTGVAKGVRWTQRLFHAQIRGIRDMFGLEAGQTTVECFASFAIHDLCIGLTVVIPDMDLSRLARVDPAKVVRAIDMFQPEVSLASPVVWDKVTRYCVREDIVLESLRTVMTMGAPIPPNLVERFTRCVSVEAELFTPYGATECLPVSKMGSKEILAETAALAQQGKGTCVGRPVSEATVRVIAIDEGPIAAWDESLALPVGEIGEIIVRGPMASPLYTDNPEATARAKIPTADGGFFHRMGDLGYLDETGRIWFCGRMSHRLQTEQGLLPAVMGENIFNGYPGVKRTAVVGVGEPGHQQPVLVVELEPEATWSPEDETQLLALADGTPWQGRITKVLLHGGFPVDPRHNSKIHRGELRDWATRYGQSDPSATWF